MATVGTEKAAKQVRNVCDSVLVNPPMDEKKNMFLDKAPTMILGNYYDLKLSTDLGFKNFLMADIPHIGYVFSDPPSALPIGNAPGAIDISQLPTTNKWELPGAR